MTVRMSPCSWPMDYSACTLPARWLALTDEERAVYEAMASDYLWQWTGQAFGVCEVVLRPCRVDCPDLPSTFYGSGPYAGGAGVRGGHRGVGWLPVQVGGRWLSLGCGTCGTACTCERPSALLLPGPVDHVTAVVLDGEPLPEAAWAVDGSTYLRRVDGGAWPTCQDLTLPDGTVGTWSVTYGRGTRVPAGGQVAAGLLAVELWKAACSDPSCALPRRVQSISRQGVTVAVLDAFDDVEQGRTGIWLVDSWVASVTRPPARSRVYSPDVPRGPGRAGVMVPAVPPPPIPGPGPVVIDGGGP